MAITDVNLFHPQDERSKTAGYWQLGIDNLMDEGWRICYTDGTGGRTGKTAAGTYCQDKFNEDTTYGQYAGELSTVADAERLAIALVLEKEDTNMLAIASDSQAALATLGNISQGHPPRSGIEKRIKTALTLNPHRDVGYLWVRAHIAIRGNELADKRADYESILGDISGATQIATPEGVRARSRAVRKSTRTEAGFGQRRSEWNRHSLSAYIWTRTERGPTKQWLHHIGKADSPRCSCPDEPPETGHHIVFHCPRFAVIRADFLGERANWEELDEPVWKKEGEGEDAEYFEATEEFFGHLYGALTGR